MQSRYSCGDIMTIAVLCISKSYVQPQSHHQPLLRVNYFVRDTSVAHLIYAAQIGSRYRLTTYGLASDTVLIMMGSDIGKCSAGHLPRLTCHSPFLDLEDMCFVARLI